MFHFTLSYHIGLALCLDLSFRCADLPLSIRFKPNAAPANQVGGFGGSIAILEILGIEVLLHVFPLFVQSGFASQLLNVVGYTFALLLGALSFTIAILRSRLYDIDLLINRTLVYGALTGVLAMVYLGLVIILQFLLRGMLNQNNDVAIVGSTLLIAALFQPLRHRIQQVIDRSFYRHKYDAARTLTAFSATLRNEVDLNHLSEQLVGVVQETMQPAHVSLWLLNPQQYRERNTQLLPRIDEEERGPS